jgi:DNA-binding CsgD family transcriptional regulator
MSDFRHSRELLTTASEYIETFDSPLQTASLDVQACEAGLARAQEDIAKRLGTEPDKPTRQRLIVLLLQLNDELVSLREVALSQRSAAVVAVQEALEHLRPTTSVPQLLERIPKEICGLGFARSLVSQVSDSVWISRYAFVDQDDELASLMVRAGSEEPTRITPRLLESELVRRRRPMIVRDPQRNPGMHERFKVVTKTQGYVAAPVLACDRVIGFLHADQYLGYKRINDDFSRDILSMLAEGIGYAVERMVFQQRLEALRGRLSEYTRHVNDLVATCADADIDLSPTSGEHAETASPGTAAALIGQLDSRVAASPLTRRELEILRHMASGATNAQIATRLVLSEGTVKSHVKHILRKLAASNRAQAVAYYHRLAIAPVPRPGFPIDS